MEKAQLCDCAYNNQLQKSIYLCKEANDVSNMAGEHTLAEPKLKVTP